jgi:SMC interacting uncharacterized protein involved in chromosome segregation
LEAFVEQNKAQRDNIDALQDQIAEIEEKLQQLKALAEKIEQVEEKMEALLPKLEQFVGSDPEGQMGPNEINHKVARLKQQAAIVQTQIADLQAAIAEAAERCRKASAGAPPTVEGGARNTSSAGEPWQPRPSSRAPAATRPKPRSKMQLLG